MDCQDAVKLLRKGLQRGLSVDERARLDDHLATCQVCREVRKGYRRERPQEQGTGGAGQTAREQAPGAQPGPRRTGPTPGPPSTRARRRSAAKRHRRPASTVRSPAAAHLDPDEAGVVDIPGYDIMEVIGFGAMGTVYKARQLSMDRLVALKVLSPEMAQDEEFMERFLREARVSGRLNHLNVVGVFDAGHAGKTYYLAMEYVEGRSVKERLKRGTKFSEGQAADICLQVARALEHASRYDLIHRDVKPDNILITAEGVVKLCDLGLSKPMTGTADITQDGVVVGTPFYIAPEQAKGSADVDARADIYSLGCTLYHMLTGRVPFDGKTSAVVMTRHMTDPFPDPREVVPGVSAGCVTILFRTVQKDREKRYPSAKNLCGDLEALLEGRFLGEPVQPKAAEPVVVQARPPHRASARRRPKSTAHLKRARGSRSVRGSQGSALVLVMMGLALVALLVAFLLAQGRGRAVPPGRRTARRSAGSPGRGGGSMAREGRTAHGEDAAGPHAGADAAVDRVARSFRADPSKAEPQLRELDHAVKGVRDAGLSDRAAALRAEIVAVLDERAREYVQRTRARADELVAKERFGEALRDGGPLDLKTAPARARRQLASTRSQVYAKARQVLQQRIDDSPDPVHEFMVITRGMPGSVVEKAREQLGVKGEGK